MSLEIFLDIETLPCADPDLIAELTAGIRPPGSMKRADTIAKWEAEERPQAVADAISKTSLDGSYGRVCCIGWAIGDGDPQSVVGPNERELLTEFYAQISANINLHNITGRIVPFIGHNIAGFDLPFLRKRTVVHGVKPPAPLAFAMTARSWDGCIADTMLMWDADRDKRISLDRLCKVLSIPSPKADGIDGSKVAELFAAGEYERLDVVASRLCYRAMTFS
jgi:hypothetical protein